jgi:phage baseplate assembly protein W
MQNLKSLPVYHVFWGQSLDRASFEEHIRYTLRSAILTRIGERHHHPEIGSTVTDFLFRPLSPTLRSEIATTLREAIEKSESRVEVRAIDVGPDTSPALEPSGLGRIRVAVSYIIKATSRLDKLTIQI